MSSQLKALPRIKEQLALLGDEIKDIETYQGLPELFQEPLPPLPDSSERVKNLEKILADYENQIRKEQALKPTSYTSDEPAGWVPQYEFKRLEDYGREKMGITEKTVPATDESEEFAADLDINIDKDVSSEWGLPTLTELAINKDKDGWIETKKEVTESLKNCTRKINKHRKNIQMK